jgi:geranylgeranylglycerol-phosphate geranylgeranyltransferase
LLKTAVAWMVVVRFGTGICLAAAIVIPLLMHGSSPADAATAALPFVLAAMGGFALNDYYDVEKDRISKPYRPLVSRSLDRDIVGLVGVALICVSATLALHSYASLTALTLQLSAAIGVLVYNYVVRYVGLLKGVVAAITSCLPLVYVVLETASPLAEVHLFFWAAFLFLTGREVLMDALDVAGDSAGGVNTLAVLFGTKPSEIVGWGLVGLGVAMLATFHVPLTTAFYLTVVLVALLSASWLWVGDERVRTRRWVVRALWLPMLIAVLLLG